jgi:aspartate/methionine/tyrosine aminotransferase
MLASPGNPTGTSMDHQTLESIINAVHSRAGFVVMDEIYLGLSNQQERRSELSLNQNLIILNSFSKYFQMTGCRLGWMIVPPHMIEPVERLASSLAICPSTLAQHAALSCFNAESLAVFEHRREAFRQRRDYLVGALESIGLSVPAQPDGAFYVYADISRFSSDSDQLASQLLERAGVAVVPGKDFGPTHAKRMIRVSYTIGLDRLEQAIERMRLSLHDL